MHPILRRPDRRTFAHKTHKAPVDHGGVAGVDVDADAVAGLGVAGAADGVQALQTRARTRMRAGWVSALRSG